MTKPQQGDEIEIQLPFGVKDDPWLQATVCCSLAVQFTATVEGHGTEFFFYKHEGDSWRHKTKQNQE